MTLIINGETKEFSDGFSLQNIITDMSSIKTAFLCQLRK